MKKDIILVTLMAFAIVWLVIAVTSKDKDNTNHCVTRSVVCSVAAFIINALPD